MSRSWSGRPRQRKFQRPRSGWRRFFDYALTAAIFALVALVAMRLDRVNMRVSEGQAVVNDGDTITLGGERIRLVGIDAPEFSQVCRKDGEDYPCGRRSREALSRLIAGRPVACSGWERDKYDRLLGECRAGDVDLNSALVAAGWAVSYGGYQTEELAARRAGSGLWAGEFDRPRDWRAVHGGMGEAPHDGYSRIVNWLREIFRFS